jgi:hypothetical protein
MPYICTYIEDANFVLKSQTQMKKQYILPALVFLTLNTNAQNLIHYWHFNNLSGTVDSVAADYSVHANAPVITYPGSGAGYMDDVNDGDTTNLRQGQIAGTGLRVRNPSDTRELIIPLPTTGFEDISFSYAANRTNNGAARQWLSFSTDGGISWSNAAPFADTLEVEPEYNLEIFDFSNVTGVNDNPDFVVRIEFFDGASNISGNNRFDNIVLEGVSLTGGPTPDYDLILYWHFNNLSGTVSGAVPADYSKIPNIYPNINYIGTGDGYMDDFSPGSPLNLFRNEPPGNALRVRNPSFDRALIIELPTTECEDVALMYDVHRSGSGMLFNNIAYSVDGVNYDTVGMDIKQVSISESYQTFFFDFKNISGANNNPYFKVRITWSGNTNQPNGNNRYDNIVLLAEKTTLSSIHWKSNDDIRIYPQPANDYFQFEWGNINGEITYQLIDMQGRHVQDGVFAESDTKHIKTVNLPSGTYILRLIAGDRMAVKKVQVGR